MPQSLSQVLVHMVYSTKDRNQCIDPATQPRLHAYLSKVLASDGHVPIIVGGHTDHVHLLFGLSRTVTIAKTVESTKVSSSKWIKEVFPHLPSFAWQHGYGAFSVVPHDQRALVEYITHQEEHHRTFSFQDEYRNLLIEFGVPYDEKFLWD
jgi:putative transposase